MIKKNIVIICGLILTGTLAFGQEKDLNPKMDSTGKISCANKSISFKKTYAQIEIAIGKQVNLSGFSLLNIGKAWINSCHFINKKRTTINNSISWTSDIIAALGTKKIIGQYTSSIILQKDNLIKISHKYKLSSDIKVKYAPLYLDSIGKEKLSGYYNVGNRKAEFESSKFDKFLPDSGVIFTFFPNDSAKTFRIIPKIYSLLRIKGTSGRLIFSPDKEGNVEFLLDMTPKIQSDSKETK